MKTKINIKKSIALIIGVILMLCTLSACTSSGKSPVGKWYNEKGKCLDVRKDNTWKLEGNYGTGTWKKIDNETFEFIDFYGDTQESGINEDDLGQYIDFGYYGNFYKDVKDNAENLETNVDATDVVFNKIKEFNSGVAWVTYTNADEQEMICLIDTKGKKLYEDVYNHKTHKDFNGDVSWFFGVDDEILLINNSGKIITTSVKSNFDKIIGYGDGLFLVYKNKSTITEEKHLYTAIDKNGKQLFSPIDLECEPDEEACYAGCGIFIVSGKENVKVLFNYKTQKKVYINTQTAAEHINFVDNIARFSNEVYISDTGDFSYSTKGNYFALDTSFELKEIEYFNYITDGIAVQCNGYMMPTVEYVSITEIKTNKKTEIKKYPSNQIGTIAFNGKYGTIKIIGKDGKSYFSLIDRKGNFQFEPICCTSASFSDEYMTFKNQDKTYGICDVTGKILANNLNETNISQFNNGIAVASYSRYIDSTGKEIKMQLK